MLSPASSIASLPTSEAAAEGGAGKSSGSKLDSLPREQLMKFLKKQQLMIKKYKERIEELTNLRTVDESSEIVSGLELELQKVKTALKEQSEQNSVLSETLAQLRTNLETSQCENSAATSKIAQLTQDIEALRTERGALEDQVGTYESRLQTEIATRENAIAELHSEISRLKEEADLAAAPTKSGDGWDSDFGADETVESARDCQNCLALNEKVVTLESQIKVAEESGATSLKGVDEVEESEHVAKLIAELDAYKEKVQLLEKKEQQQSTPTTCEKCEDWKEKYECDLSALKVEMEEKVQGALDKVSHLETELAERAREKEEYTTQLQRLKANFEEKEIEFEKRLEESQERFEAEARERSDIEEALAVSKRNVDLLTKELEDAGKALEAQRQKSSEDRPDTANLLSLEMADFERSIENLQQEIHDRELKLQNVEGLLASKENEMSSVRKELELVRGQRSKMEELLRGEERKKAEAELQNEQRLSELAEREAQIKDLVNRLQVHEDELEAAKVELANNAAHAMSIESNFQELIAGKEKELANVTKQRERLKEEYDGTRAKLAELQKEYRDYKVKVQTVLKQQRQAADASSWEEEKEQLTSTIDTLQRKLTESQSTLTNLKVDYNALQEEHDRILSKVKEQQTSMERKEKSFKMRLDQVTSESETEAQKHIERLRQLSLQNEQLRNEFQARIAQMQKSNQDTVHDLEHQVVFLESQLNKLSSKASTPVESLDGGSRPEADSVLSAQVHLQSPLEKRSPIFRQDTADSSTPKASPPHTPIPPSLAELLMSDPESSRVQSPTRGLNESLSSCDPKLLLAAKRIEHLTEVLSEVEATNEHLEEQARVLKEEIRRLERNEERQKHVANSEYLKNVILKFLSLEALDERQRLIPVLQTMLTLSSEEVDRLKSFIESVSHQPSHGIPAPASVAMSLAGNAVGTVSNLSNYLYKWSTGHKEESS